MKNKVRLDLSWTSSDHRSFKILEEEELRLEVEVEVELNELKVQEKLLKIKITEKYPSLCYSLGIEPPGSQTARQEQKKDTRISKVWITILDKK